MCVGGICDICGHHCPSTGHYAHQRRHTLRLYRSTGCPDVSCPEKRIFHEKFALEYHFTEHHRQPVAPDDPTAEAAFICPVQECTFQSTTAIEMGKHAVEAHEELTLREPKKVYRKPSIPAKRKSFFGGGRFAQPKEEERGEEEIPASFGDQARDITRRSVGMTAAYRSSFSAPTTPVVSEEFILNSSSPDFSSDEDDGVGDRAIRRELGSGKARIGFGSGGSLPADIGGLPFDRVPDIDMASETGRESTSRPDLTSARVSDIDSSPDTGRTPTPTPSIGGLPLGRAEEVLDLVGEESSEEE